MEKWLYDLQMPKEQTVPIVISIPHAGVDIPVELQAQYDPLRLQTLEDTDWFVWRLYDFAKDLGITVLRAKISRYVVDLNRDPSQQKLYQDGRLETQVVPHHTFLGKALYVNEPPNAVAQEHRLSLYYRPYHEALSNIANALHQQFGRVLIFDAHSIRRCVPTIRAQAFASLILGDQQGKTAASTISKKALTILRNQNKWEVAYNDPFQGGFITRSFGRPAQHYHALQLEMAQDLYMDDKRYSEKKAQQIKPLLRLLLEGLVDALLQPFSP